MRIGTDIVEIYRIKGAVDRSVKFAERILTANELAIYESYPELRRYEFLAGRFSAKEAYGKALRTGVGTQVKFVDIEILPDNFGVPHITQGPIVEGAHISYSHAKEYATAVALIELNEDDIEKQLSAFHQHKEEQNG